MPSKAVVSIREQRPVTRGSFMAPVQHSWGDAGSAALVSVANRRLLAHALGWLAAGGIREAAIVVSGRLAPQVRAAAAEDAPPGIALQWVEQLATETPREAVAALDDFLGDDPFVLHLADSLARPCLGSLIGNGEVRAGEALLVVHPSAGASPEGVVDLRARRNGVSELERLGWAFGGVLVLGQGLADVAAAVNAEGGRELELITQLVERFGGRMQTRRASDWWRFRSGADALLEGNRFALEGLRAHFDEDSLVGSRVQGSVVIHPSARLESSIVRGPAIIGPDARLKDAYVGPYTSIGRDVLIEGAEVEHSIVLEGASVSYLGGRLEASIVGPRARVYRDFRLPKAVRLNLGAGAEVSLA